MSLPILGGRPRIRRDYVDPVVDFGLVPGPVDFAGALANAQAMQDACNHAAARKVPVRLRASATDADPDQAYVVGEHFAPPDDLLIEGDHPKTTILRSHPELLANGPIISQRRTFSPTTYHPMKGLRLRRVTLDGDWEHNAEFQRKITLAEDLSPSSTSARFVEKDVIAQMPSAGRISFHEGDTGSNNPDFNYTHKDDSTGTLLGLTWITNSHSSPGFVPAGTVFYDHLHSSLGLFHLNTWDDVEVVDCVFKNAGGYVMSTTANGPQLPTGTAFTYMENVPPRALAITLSGVLPDMTGTFPQNNLDRVPFLAVTA